jgi:hypothetical protein
MAYTLDKEYLFDVSKFKLDSTSTTTVKNTWTSQIVNNKKIFYSNSKERLSATFSISSNNLPSGNYDVYVTFPPNARYTTEAPYMIYYGNNKTKEVIVNQTVTTSNGWVYLGNYNFTKNDAKHGIVLLSRNKLNVVVESIKFVAKNPVSAEYFNNNIIIEKFKSNNQIVKTNIEHFNPTDSKSLMILIFMFLVILGLVYIFYNYDK